MQAIDRILGCTARVFGLSWPPRADADPSQAERFAARRVGLDALECGEAEGLAAARVDREDGDCTMNGR